MRTSEPKASLRPLEKTIDQRHPANSFYRASVMPHHFDLSTNPVNLAGNLPARLALIGTGAMGESFRRVAAFACIWFCSIDVAMADQKPPETLFVAGYSNQVSVAPGDEIAFHLSSSASKVDIVIERLGQSQEQVWEQTGIATVLRPIPDRASSDGCKWPESHRLTIPDGWRSGYYQATMHARQDGNEAKGTMFFIVRSAQPGRTSQVLLQLSTHTYNAYTNWGGHSLYGYHDRDGIQGHRVSYDRPLQSQFENWERPFVAWAESQGIELDYAANGDLSRHGEILSNYRLVLSVGHDEYWSSAMRDNLENYITGGGNVAFFSGNTCCWQVREEDDGRALTCWKQNLTVDPLFRSDKEHLLGSLWSHHRIGRPENTLTGVGFLWGGYHRSHGELMDGPASYEIHRPEHWIFEGTELRLGDRLGGKDTIVGYECDGCEMRWENGLPYPTGRDGTPSNFTILATCPARWAAGDSVWYERFPKDRVGASVMGLYTRGGTVFTCGSTDWAHGLKGEDAAVDRITRNIVLKLSEPSEPTAR